MAKQQKGQPEVINPLETMEDFDRIRERDYPKCVVVDVHLTWCGPCEVMKPNFKTMYFTYEQPEDRLELYTMDSSIITDNVVLDKLGKIT